MSSKDIAYYLQRASLERDRANCAPTAEIAAIHEQLSAHYENVIESLRRGAEISDVVDPFDSEGSRQIRPGSGS